MTAKGQAADPIVPGYLGRVLYSDGEPAGTCFQVAPGVLVTACHVLDDIGGADPDAVVRVDPLGGGDWFDAAVAYADPVHDLAVLTCEMGLAQTSGPLTATGRVALRTPVSVTGHCVLNDPTSPGKRFLTAVGTWAGPAMREDAVVVGRMTMDAVLPGMSGAPVIRDSDGRVAGVVSGRYNSADGWLDGTVWVSRTEDLLPLLAGLAVDTEMVEIPAGPVDLVMTVTAGRVTLAGPGMEVSANHSGVGPGLAGAVHEARRARAGTGMTVRAQLEVMRPTGSMSLSRAGALLGGSFLPGPVAVALERVLALAERAHQVVRIGLEITPDLAWLPWEALPGPDGRPLALHPLVSLYRKTGAAPVRALPGPLRIVVAIAAPDRGGGPVLDYERELRNVLAAVRSARQDAADVRVVPFATAAAIRDELDRGPVHVLHISGHGSPGTVDLEDDDGGARPVTAEEFLAQAVPPGKMPPVIAMSACYTDAAVEGGASFAARLCQHGAAAVIATETSVTDLYATRLLARVYAALARASAPDVVAALSEARREIQAELETSPGQRDQELAALGEWAAVTILAASGSVPVLDQGTPGQEAARPSRLRVAGLAGRDDWYFVGRRAEQRRWPADLTASPLAGIVVHGTGGTGKTTLAAEITARILARDPSRILVSVTGPLTLEGLLGHLISAVRRNLLVRNQEGTAIRALDVAARAELGWQDRWAVLREHVLGAVPVLAVLDNFEDNLQAASGAGHAVRDEVLAGLLAEWVTDPGAARLLITSRYPFTLPGGADQALSFRQIKPLSRAETMKLAWSLPALDRLDETQMDQVWRLVGGHPRSLEYLDALLSGGTARYPDVTARLDAAISRRLDETGRDRWLAARTGLDAALAETVALAADDVMLDDLLARLAQIPGAADLLLRVSVYREPVDLNAVLFQAGQPDPKAESPDVRAAAVQRVTEILAGAGITWDDVEDESFDMARAPEQVRALLAPDIEELNREPEPPFRPPAGLAGQITACQAASLLTVSTAERKPRFFVHRWTAAELAWQADRDHGPQLEQAHRQAAGYWQWRVQVRVWPDDDAADLHDLLEARYHLLHAGAIEDAALLTERIFSQLHTWGAWDEEASLLHDTITRLPADSPLQAVSIHQLGMIAEARGDYGEAERLYQRALDISEQLGNQANAAVGYLHLGNLAYQRGDYDEAARQFQRSLDINERLGNQTGMARSHHNLGSVAYERRDHDEADRQFRRSLDISRRLEDQAGMADSYHQLGAIAQRRGDLDEADRQFRRSLTISERLGDQARIATTFHSLGNMAYLRQDDDQAALQYQRSLDISERLGDQASMANTYRQLGMIAQRHGDLDEASRQFRRSLDISERLGDQASMANTYCQFGIIAQERGDYDEAVRLYRRSLDISATDEHRTSEILSDLGDALQALERFPEAVTAYQDAIQIYRDTGDQHDEGMAKALNSLGNVLRQVQRSEEAITAYQDALEIYRDTGDRHGEATALNCLGVARQDLERFPEAITAYQDALQIYRDTGDRHDEGMALNNLGNSLEMLERFPEAVTAYRDAIRIFRETGDEHAEGVVLDNLKGALRELGPSPEAINAYQDALQIYRDTGDSPGAATALDGLGIALFQAGRFEEAIGIFQDSVQVNRDTGDRRGEGQALNGLGVVLEKVRRLAEAITAYQDAIRIFRKIGDKHTEGVILGNLGNTLRELEWLPETYREDSAAEDTGPDSGFQHCVDKTVIQQAIASQQPVEALCGSTWVPERAGTTELPACPACQAKIRPAPRRRRPWGGR
jgi:tetratricopeptide (TPR) repeat protein